MKPEIVVIGSANMDLVVRSSRVPIPGESLLGDGYFYCGGGKGANQAIGATRLGAKTRFIGRVGQDTNGDALRRSLSTAGVDTIDLISDAEAPTGLAVIMLEADGSNRITVIPGANMRVNQSDIENIGSAGHKPDAILLQFEIPQEAVIAVCRYGVENKICTVVDAGPAQDFPLEKIQGITVLSPNETEAERLCGFAVETDEAALAASQVLQKRCQAKYIVMKRGRNGASLYDGNLFETFEAVKNVAVVDTTAAGDCFTAALALKLVETGDIREAIRYANRAAAVKIQKMGAHTGMPSKEEVEQGKPYFAY